MKSSYNLPVIATLSLAMTMFVAAPMSAAVARDETPAYTAALGACVEDKLVDEAGLDRILSACERNEIANPFVRDEAELDTAKWHAYETIQEWINAGNLNPAQVCTWSKKAKAEQTQERQERGRTKEETSAALNTNYPRFMGAGENYTCMVCANRTLHCFGQPQDWFAQANAIGQVKAISVAGKSACAIKTDDKVTCWGDAQPVEVEQFGAVRAISVGPDGHVCALNKNRTFLCLGSNSKDDILTLPVPTHMLGAQVAGIHAGYYCSCIVQQDGSFECWGNNREVYPLTEFGAVKSVAVGQGVFCAANLEGLVRCKGYLGGSMENAQPFANNGVVKSLSMGVHGPLFGILWDGRVACWWFFMNNTRCDFPSDLGPVREIAVGEHHVCAALMDNTVRCFNGENKYGETTVDPNLRVFDGAQE